MNNWTRTSIFANETDGIIGTITNEWVSTVQNERFIIIRLSETIEISVNRATADTLATAFSTAAAMLTPEPDPWRDDDAPDTMAAFIGVLPTIRD